jgi:hypothetical protein
MDSLLVNLPSYKLKPELFRFDAQRVVDGFSLREVIFRGFELDRQAVYLGLQLTDLVFATRLGVVGVSGSTVFCFILDEIPSFLDFELYR